MSVCTSPLLFITIVSRYESLILLLSIVKIKLGCKVFISSWTFVRSSSDFVNRMKQSSKKYLKFSPKYVLKSKSKTSSIFYRVFLLDIQVQELHISVWISCPFQSLLSARSTYHWNKNNCFLKWIWFLRAEILSIALLATPVETFSTSILRLLSQDHGKYSCKG